MVSELSVKCGHSETGGFNWCQISLENCDVPGIDLQAILEKAQRLLYSWSKIDFVSQVTKSLIVEELRIRAGKLTKSKYG